MQNADSDDNRIRAQSEFAAAKDRVDRYEDRLANVSVETPDVQVGTLEQLLDQMEKADAGRWQEVMFVPPGALDKKALGE